MLSRSKLKTKIIDFRDRLEPPREQFGPWPSPIAPDQPRFIGNRNKADLLVLDQWIERCGQEDFDEKLKNLLDVITAPELFRLVLQGRHKALTTVNRTYGVKWKTATRAGEVVGLDTEWRKLKDKLTDNISLENLEILERAVFLHSDYAGLVGNFNEEPSQRKGDARRNRLFWDFVGNHLYLRSGNQFDREVAILTEIAFDLLSGTINPEQIVDARRQR